MIETRVPSRIEAGTWPGSPTPATCNGRNQFGCPQRVRALAIDSRKHIIYIPNIGDSDVATLDADTCRAGHVNDSHVKIVPKRMGGFPEVATVDEGSETVYVANNDDGTVSVFPSSR